MLLQSDRVLLLHAARVLLLQADRVCYCRLIVCVIVG